MQVACAIPIIESFIEGKRSFQMSDSILSTYLLKNRPDACQQIGLTFKVAAVLIDQSYSRLPLRDRFFISKHRQGSVAGLDGIVDRFVARARRNCLDVVMREIGQVRSKIRRVQLFKTVPYCAMSSNSLRRGNRIIDRPSNHRAPQPLTPPPPLLPNPHPC